MRESTASIEARLPEKKSWENLLQTNYLLLIEQATNLQIILSDLEDDNSLEKK